MSRILNIEGNKFPMDKVRALRAEILRGIDDIKAGHAPDGPQVMADFKRVLLKMRSRLKIETPSVLE
jgi:hypothetical protein